jgi:hypothetical protein
LALVGQQVTTERSVIKAVIAYWLPSHQKVVVLVELTIILLVLLVVPAVPVVVVEIQVVAQQFLVAQALQIKVTPVAIGAVFMVQTTLVAVAVALVKRVEMLLTAAVQQHQQLQVVMV